MADEGKRTLAQEISSWMQILGIVVAAAWGAWTFVYKEIVVPKSAPVNVTVDLELKKISGGQPGENKKKLIPVQFKVSAKNPSTREIYLLPSVWMATGAKITPGDHEIGDLPAISSRNEQTVAQRHAAVTENVIIAFGGLVEDDSLKPNEVTTRTFILYVPPNEYDSIDLLTIVPTIAEKGKVDLEWKLDSEKGQIVPTWYRLDAKGAKQGGVSDEEVSAFSKDHKLELQRSVTRATLSLWQ
jgi:hypothetical protein